MPGHVIVETMTLQDLGDGRTRLVTVSLFHTTEERDGMLHSGMEQGVNQSHAALTNVARARAFYEEALGLTVGMAGGQGDMPWIEYDLPAGAGGRRDRLGRRPAASRRRPSTRIAEALEGIESLLWR